MSLEKHRLTYFVSVIAITLLISAGCGEKKADEQNAETSTEQTSNSNSDLASVDIGLPIYPGAEQDPENPPINTPHMKNLKLLTGDSLMMLLSGTPKSSANSKLMNSKMEIKLCGIWKLTAQFNRQR